MKEGRLAFDKRRIEGKKNYGVRRDILPRLWLGWSGGYGSSKTEKTKATYGQMTKVSKKRAPQPAIKPYKTANLRKLQTL